MPFLAPLVPLLFSLPELAGGLLAGPIGGALTAIGIPEAFATPLAGFLSPEIIGGGLGEAFGGTKGLEEGLLAGATMGGGLGSFGNLLDTGLSAMGAPGLGEAVGGAFTDPLGLTGTSMAGSALGAASPFIQGAINQPNVSTPPPPSTIASPTQGNTVGATPPGGPSGMTLSGNTAPQVGPWLSNFWNPTGMNIPNSTGNMPSSTGSAAPATSSVPSATNQQQLVSP